ncbi:MAG: biotin synthase BioB [Parachlamydiaceae bacterium]|nr:biotin synthase BioB [Parachlamydiaceae bacterium]
MTQYVEKWTLNELKIIYDQPLLKLISQANAIHTTFHDQQEVQVCSLISIKTGGCPEDCKYCSQSSRYQTPTQAQAMMEFDEVLEVARNAIDRGATRICLGAAWREIRDNHQFENALKMIRSIAELGVEVCCTFGMLKEHQAIRLKESGLYAYNHNLDSSERFYKTIITSRTYQDRLKTLDIVEKTGISVCCGGIIGMGEKPEDRLELLLTLSKRNSPPESIPINCLAPIPGTPFENQPKLSIWELIRMIATTRIVFPRAMVRLSAGRADMSHEEHALCFLAGANSIFAGDRLLTIANMPIDKDEEMFRIFGLKKRPSYSTTKSEV